MQIHISLSSLWSCSATVMANLNPSLTIKAVSIDWTEVVMANVMLTDNILTDRRGTHGSPNAFNTFAHERALYCTARKRPSFSHIFPHWNISKLFQSTFEGVNRKLTLTESQPNLSNFFSYIIMCASSLFIFTFLVMYVYKSYPPNRYTKTHTQYYIVGSDLLSVLNKHNESSLTTGMNI